MRIIKLFFILVLCQPLSGQVFEIAGGTQFPLIRTNLLEDYSPQPGIYLSLIHANDYNVHWSLKPELRLQVSRGQLTVYDPHFVSSVIGVVFDPLIESKISWFEVIFCIGPEYKINHNLSVGIGLNAFVGLPIGGVITNGSEGVVLIQHLDYTAVRLAASFRQLSASAYFETGYTFNKWRISARYGFSPLNSFDQDDEYDYYIHRDNASIGIGYQLF